MQPISLANPRGSCERYDALRRRYFVELDALDTG
jgi:hypothetical protein